MKRFREHIMHVSSIRYATVFQDELIRSPNTS